VKVTDKRMFTDDGELREEYRFLEQQKEAGGPRAAAPQEEPSRPAAADPVVPEAPVPEGRGPATDRGPSPGEVGEYESPAGGPRPGPGFMDLVAMLAEPIAFLLGDAQLPDGQSAEDLPRARLQIDLLAVLQEKTRGNVSAEESAVLENLLAQLRMRYVEKTRG
jgi:hypothetical protein